MVRWMRRGCNDRWNSIVLVVTGFMLLFTLGIYLYVYHTGTMNMQIEGFCISGLSIGIDRFRGLYGFLCTLIWFVAMVVARDEMKEMEHCVRFYIGTLLTYVATMGIFYADNLALVYILFEVMSICSYLWVAQEQNQESKSASELYLVVSVMSGLVMLMGVIILYCNIGTLEFGQMRNIVVSGQVNKAQLYLGAGCLLFGFGTKAGAFPMHFYLHSAYPAAPAPAAAILSAALTKAGIFGILILTGEICFRDTNWAMCLVILGVMTMLFNAVWGMFQTDVMRILACSSVSQLGFILLGCGMIGMLQEEGALAVQGTVLYMVNHSLFKLILFLACGILSKRAGSRMLTELKGIGRKYKIFMIPVLTGCAGLAGIPLFSGYIAKALLHESIVEYCELSGGNVFFGVIEWLFLITGGCTFAYVTKIFVTLFVEKGTCDVDKAQERVSLASKVSIWIPAVFSLAGGIFPYLVMNSISDLKDAYEMHRIAYFSLTNLKGAGISIMIGILLYLLLVRPFLGQERIPAWMSMEKYVYRPLFTKVLPGIGEAFARILDGVVPVLQQPLVAVMSGFAMFMDGIVPVLQKAGMKILGFCASVCSNAADFVILIMEGTVFNSSKHFQLKRNKDTEVMLHEVSQTTRIIQASLSFGFLMVCFGLCITLLYLLWG